MNGVGGQYGLIFKIWIQLNTAFSHHCCPSTLSYSIQNLQSYSVLELLYVKVGQKKVIKSRFDFVALKMTLTVCDTYPALLQKQNHMLLESHEHCCEWLKQRALFAAIHIAVLDQVYSTIAKVKIENSGMPPMTHRFGTHDKSCVAHRGGLSFVFFERR